MIVPICGETLEFGVAIVMNVSDYPKTGCRRFSNYHVFGCQPADLQEGVKHR